MFYLMAELVLFLPNRRIKFMKNNEEKHNQKFYFVNITNLENSELTINSSTNDNKDDMNYNLYKVMIIKTFLK